MASTLDRPPDAAEAPEGAPTKNAALAKRHTQGTACICRDCCTTGVDHVASDLLRSVSPLAEYVSRRLEVLG